MRGVLRKHGFVRQPTGQNGLDLTNPLARKITGGIAAHYGAGRIDLVSGIIGTVGNAIPRKEDRSGGRATSGGSSSSWLLPPKPGYGDLSKVCSLEFYFSGNGPLTNNDRGIDFAGLQTGGSGGGWDLEYAATNNPVFVTWFSSFNFGQTVAAGSLANNRPTHLIITTTGNSSGANNWFSWVNGKFEAGWFTNTTASGADKLRVHCSFVAPGNNSGDWPFYFFHAYHGTILSKAEIARRAARPWEVYQPGGRIVTGLPTVPPPNVPATPYYWPIQT